MKIKVDTTPSTPNLTLLKKRNAQATITYIYIYIFGISERIKNTLTKHDISTALHTHKNLYTCITYITCVLQVFYTCIAYVAHFIVYNDAAYQSLYNSRVVVCPCIPKPLQQQSCEVLLHTKAFVTAVSHEVPLHTKAFITT